MGVLLAYYFNFPSQLIVVGLISSTVSIAVGVLHRYVYLTPIIIIGAVILGMIRGSALQDSLMNYSYYYGKTVHISGQVKDDIDIAPSNQIVIRLGDVSVEKNELPGTIWVTTKPVSNIKRGDLLVVSGVLKEGFGTFPATVYRANVEKIIHPLPGDIARIIRDWFSEAISRAIPDPEASLGVGYLVGQRRALPADLVMALQFAGLTHIVVASGYNLTILVRLTRRTFARVSKYIAALSATLLIFCFLSITGMSPSMVRAGIVTGLSLAAWYYGRRFHPLVLLAIAMAATVMINPSYAWGDLGWQLSFAAFAGVMIVAPLGQRYFFGNKKPGTIAQIFGETIAAQLVTAPIIIMAFGQFSNVAILANLFILPFVPLAMLLTFIAGIFGALLPSLAASLSMPAYWLLHYMVIVAKFFADLPWSISEVRPSWWFVVVVYGVIVGFCVYMWRKTKYNLRETNLIE